MPVMLHRFPPVAYDLQMIFHRAFAQDSGKMYQFTGSLAKGGTSATKPAVLNTMTMNVASLKAFFHLTFLKKDIATRNAGKRRAYNTSYIEQIVPAIHD
jgi:hypothetical protein